MRVVTNEALIRRYRKFSQYLFFASLGGMAIGFFYSWTNPEGSSQISCMILPLLFLMTITSVRMANTWIREPRPVPVLTEALKGIGQKYTLFNYMMPAHHVLIGPEGVFTLHILWQDRVPYSVSGSKWSGDSGLMRRLNGYMRQDLIGNPFVEAQYQAQQVQKMLSRLAPSTKFEVQPVIVITSPRAQVTIDNPALPVVYADPKKSPSLRDYLRDQRDSTRGTLTDADLDALDRAYGLLTRDQVEAIESGELVFDPATGNYYAAADLAAEGISSVAPASADDLEEEEDAGPETAGQAGTVYVVQSGQLYYIGATSGSVEDELPRLQEQARQPLEIVHTLSTPNAALLVSRFKKRFERKQQKNDWYGLSQKDLGWLKSQKGS